MGQRSERAQVMAVMRAFGQQMMGALLCFSLIAWSVVPSYAHAPKIFETIQDHLAMIEDHGHSHGFEEDLYRAMHGHSHEVSDHDHNQAFLMTENAPGPAIDYEEPWLSMGSSYGPYMPFRIERPPRV